MILYFSSLRMVKLFNKKQLKNIMMLRSKLMKLSLELIIKWKKMKKKTKMKVTVKFVNKS